MEHTITIDLAETTEKKLICSLPSQKVLETYDLNSRLCKSICEQISAVSKDATKITIIAQCSKWLEKNTWGVKIGGIEQMIRGKHDCQNAWRMKEIDRMIMGCAKGHSTFHYHTQTGFGAPSTIVMTKKSKLKKKEKLGVVKLHSPLLIVNADCSIYADGDIGDPKTSKMKIMGKATVNRQAYSDSSQGETYAKVLFDLEKGTITNITNGVSEELTKVENTAEVLEAIRGLIDGRDD